MLPKRLPQPPTGWAEAEPHTARLGNGTRVLLRPQPHTALVHVALVMDVGSRDEAPHQLGMAHFIEHMLFKGTHRRKAWHILNRLDVVGGDLNAYTTKEKTVLHATVAAQYEDRALELLADLFFNPSFPEHELEKERQVIAEEMDLYRDNPEEAIFEDFDDLVLPGHPLGHPILGRPETLPHIGRDGMLDFYNQHYGPTRLVVVVAGNLNPTASLRRLERLFGQPPKAVQPVQRRAPSPGPVQRVEHLRRIQQAHLMLGGLALHRSHPLHPALLVLNNHLGGNSMNNVLSLRIREKYGIAYNLYSTYSPFTDSGIWSVYGACEPARLPRLKQLLVRELDALCQQPLPAPKVEQMKRQFLGQLMMSLENPLAVALNQAKDWLDDGHVQAIAQQLQAIHAVDAPQLLQAARQVMAPALLNELAFVGGA